MAKTGRPLIQLSDLQSDWKEMILREMSNGANLQEVYGWLDVSAKTFSRLCRDNPEFFQTIKRGQRLSQKWWLEIGRKYMRDKDFNATLWYMNMKNRFDWADKREIKTDITSNGETVGKSVDMDMVTQFMMMAKEQTKQ